MKVSITTKALLLSLSLIGVSAQAHSLNWGNNPSGSMNGQSGQQRANPYSAPQILENLCIWCDNHGVKDIKELIGAAQ